jgi:hypothetical protein
MKHPRQIAFTASGGAVQAVVPAGFIVKADGDWLTVAYGDGPGTSTGIGGIMRDHDGDVESATSAALNSVQDYVSEELREPWPSLDLVQAVKEAAKARPTR